ncbi:hypothetical protein ACIBF6_37755 [Streptosporangium amethystogenes]|uniref:hypothetical protein n=1 Tax=Streptosporangium amethystogenes TaxID=2002 RepID=UPI0037BB82BA
MAPSLLALLRAHWKIRAMERLKAGDRWGDHDLVFATRFGGPIERTEDWKRLSARSPGTSSRPSFTRSARRWRS